MKKVIQRYSKFLEKNKIEIARKSIYKMKGTILFKLILASMFITSCSTDTKVNTMETIGTPVKISRPTTTQMTEYISFNANTIFLRKEIVRSTFQGFIQKVYKNLGDYVKSGDILFQIITKEAYATDSLRVKLSDEIFSGVVNIKSRTGGTLTELNYNVGDFVTDGEQLAVISDPSSLAVLLNVPYQHISKVKIGSNCILLLPNGEKKSGIIAKSLPSVDLISQTQTFLIEFQHSNQIPSYLNLEVKIPIKTVPNAIVLPKSAIQTNETLTDFWVMKVINDSIAIKIPIIKGIENDSLVQILEPIFPLDEKFVVEGAYGLPDTAKISVKL